MSYMAQFVRHAGRGSGGRSPLGKQEGFGEAARPPQRRALPKTGGGVMFVLLPGYTFFPGYLMRVPGYSSQNIFPVRNLFMVTRLGFPGYIPVTI